LAPRLFCSLGTVSSASDIMGKRAQHAASTQQAKAAKTVDPFEQELMPVLGQLDQAIGMVSESTVQMLQAVLPCCMKTPKDERHEFQRSMVESVEAMLKKVEESHQAELVAAKASLAEAEIKKEGAAARLQAAEGEVTQCQQDKATKDEIEANLQAALESAVNALKAGEESERNLGADKEALTKQKEETEKLVSETWEAVKNSTFEGKQWRERNKAIDEIVKVLDVAGLDASLKAALPTALKTKPAERKRFSAAAIHFAEVALTSYQKKIQEGLDNFEQEATKRSQAVEAAKEAVASAEEKLGAAKAETTAAKEALKNALKSTAEIEKEIKAAPATLAKLRKEVDKAAALQATSEAAFAQFQGLKERGPAAQEAKPDEVAGQEITA